MTEAAPCPPGRPLMQADEPAVLSAIRRSAGTWLSAEAVADEAGLPLGRVRAVLESSPEVIVEAPSGTRPRYSTRGHYRATTGLVRRYFDALLTS